MHKTLRRSVSVFIAVTITTLCVYGVVRVSGAVFPGATATASVTASAGQDSAATGAPPPRRRASANQSSGAANQSSAGSSRRSATPSQGSGSGSAKLYRCPVSGCTATSCHGATGAPPPQRAGQRQHGSSDD